MKQIQKTAEKLKTLNFNMETLILQLNINHQSMKNVQNIMTGFLVIPFMFLIFQICPKKIIIQDTENGYS